MKTRIITFLSLCAILVIVGCATQTAFKTIASVQATGMAANDSYQSLVIRGALPTNDVPRESKAFNDLQASVLIALDAVQFNSNALAPSSLVVEGQDFVNLVTSIKSTVK